MQGAPRIPPAPLVTCRSQVCLFRSLLSLCLFYWLFEGLYVLWIGGGCVKRVLGYLFNRFAHSAGTFLVCEVAVRMRRLCGLFSWWWYVLSVSCVSLCCCSSVLLPWWRSAALASTYRPGVVVLPWFALLPWCRIVALASLC